jgi:serine/threonine protein kinase
MSRQEETTIKKIDVTTDKWVMSMKGMTKNRTKDIDYNMIDILSNKMCVCSPLNGKNIPTDCLQIDVLNRLGTPSMDGEVFLLKIDKKLMAGKVMPIVEEKSYTKNIKEIQIASFLSDKVKKGITPFFPVVYGSAKCNVTLLSKNSKFKEQGYRYALIEDIVSKLTKKSDKVRFSAKTRSGHLNSIEEITEFAIEKNILISDKILSSSHIMFSELAWGDLGDFFINYGNKIGYEVWDKLLLQTLYAVRDLHSLNISHNDLHIHNLLIMYKEENDSKVTTIPLIHDFGKSEFIDKWDVQTTIKDYEHMISGLIDKNKHYKVPDNIRNKLVKMSIIIKEYTPDIPLSNILINYWTQN